jgi:DNA-binding NarL/FixJ family response regulator
MSPTSPAITTVIVEDDARYRESLAALLTHAPGFTLAETFGSALTALERIETRRTARDRAGWDLVLMDVDLPGLRGIDATRRLKAMLPETLVVVLTVFEEPSVILEAICAGADGYLLKRTPPAQLLEQLRVVASGGAPLTAGVARTVLDLVRHAPAILPPDSGAASDLGLTERERAVLRGLVDGLAYKQVADRLGISIDTVRTHVRGVYKKLQVHSVAEAVGRALRERLV